MAAEAFRVAVDGAVRLSGRLTFDTVARVRASVDAALGPQGWGQEAITFDLGAVGQADSAGLALLVQWRRAAERAGGQARFRDVPASLRAIAGLCGVEEHLFEPGAG